MDLDDERLILLLGKAASGALSAAEHVELERWIEVDATGQRRVFVDALPGARRLMDAGTPTSEPWLVIAPPATPVFRVPASRFSARFPWIGASVVAAGLVVAAFVLRVEGKLTPRPARTASSPRVIETAPGQRAQVELTDGTQVTLGPASRVEIPTTFGEPTRTVAMSGEVLFAVAHDAAHPFIVEAANTRTEDIGTRFDVRAYASDDVVRIVVADGKVAIHAVAAPSSPRARGMERSAVLGAGELATVDRAGTERVQRSVDPDEYLGWTDGCLAFREAPLGVVATEIGRWYGVTVRVAGGSLDGVRALTARWCSAPLADVLGAISTVMNVTYQRTGDTVVLYPPEPVPQRR